MCIIFLNFIKRSHECPSKYSLILAANRDEFFHRPSMAANYWEEAPYIIGGRDLTAKREGGTWFGISKYGSIGILTNYRKDKDLVGQADGNLKSRGSIITNFLKGSLAPKNYLESLFNGDTCYSPFNALLGSFDSKDGFKFIYRNNMDSACEMLEEGIYGLSNATLNCPWTKVQLGKQMFEKIISQDMEKEELIEKLITLMQNDQQNFPNHGGSAGNLTEELAASMSSIFVKVPKLLYGTRAITIVVVDNEDNVTFVEKSLVDPMNLCDPKWQINKYEFKLEKI